MEGQAHSALAIAKIVTGDVHELAWFSLSINRIAGSSSAKPT
jgi:hypothetical protein